MTGLGLLLFIGATTRSKFIVYRLMEARARLLWKDHAPRFLQISGLLIAALGLLWTFGKIWK